MKGRVKLLIAFNFPTTKLFIFINKLFINNKDFSF